MSGEETGSPGVFVHPDGRCESEEVGDGTRVWAFAHVLAGARVGRDCNVCDHAFVEGGAVLGDGVTLKNGAMVFAGVTLGDGVFVGPGAIFTNDRFPRSARLRGVPEVTRRAGDEAAWLERTVVEEGASLGAGAVIGPGLRIGRFAMVGAGAVVTHDVPPFRLVLGNPARPAGWVCRAGYRLEARDDGLVCPRCHRRPAVAADGSGIVDGC